MNGLFGLELPTPVNFVIAFVVVLALIGAATWLVRRFGGARLEAGARNRQPRLAVIDSAAVDGRRKLVIIRRDNVEHLLMIGGPTDVVVETNIMRSGAAVPREAPAVRANGGETLPRAMPLPDATHWPLQPEPAAVAAPAAVRTAPAAAPRAGANRRCRAMAGAGRACTGSGAHAATYASGARTGSAPATQRRGDCRTGRRAVAACSGATRPRASEPARAGARRGRQARARRADRSADRRCQRCQPRQHGAPA